MRHAFSTRGGGVSSSPWDTLNLAFNVDDDAEAVHENRARFLHEAELGSKVAEVHQVHGHRVERAASPSDIGRLHQVEADALWTAHPELAVAVRTADCAPVLIAAYEAPPSSWPAAVAAVHAGWRGAVAGIVKRTVATLGQAGLQPHWMRVVVGPAIGPSAFEVGEEVVEAARASLGGRAPKVRPGPKGRPLLDLPELVRTHALDAGIPDDQICVLERCTYSEPELFFSHRRDEGRTGRHLSAIRIAT
ncbi:MAG: peptidoglycan editing factor PgeF [Myxococcota bacterium]